ncbi:hypothetical protein E2562_010220 [Oryza meyeriana var. granulata]|uniref:Major facilitator superfamily (MFS) profile domain-containing protein n=1 Tax=Oryza meyeriana var. granulata TaxID=110450 RepID=A0A6G1EHR6_9ORYZ|nr:hypothetical protein E2562_010220 [Oryza meyeriana var. granulata]
MDCFLVGAERRDGRGESRLCLGSLFATVVNYGAKKIKEGRSWRLSLVLVGVPVSLFTIDAGFLLEMPNSRIQRGFYVLVLLRTVGMGEGASLLSTVTS